MRNRELSRQLVKLEELFDKTTAACGTDIELRSHWARYLCVQTAGLVENAVEELYGEYVRVRAHQTVANYAVSRIRRIQNPKTENLLQVAGAFKPEWRSELEAFVDNEGRREAIDGVMENRHLISHGRDSAITISRVREYFSKIVEVLEFIEQQLA